MNLVSLKRRFSKLNIKFLKISKNHGKKGVLYKKGDKVLGADLDKLSILGEELKDYVDTRVTNEVSYLNAIVEEKAITSSVIAAIDDNGRISAEKLPVRKYSKPDFDYIYKIDFFDVAPNQIVSVATSLIPFLEHDDAVRALMGTNMQRQAVPTVRAAITDCRYRH